MTTVEFHPFGDIDQAVFIDWDFALNAVSNLEVLAPGGEEKLPINKKAAINILAEYGSITHKCVYPPEKSKLAIVISPPFVRFCPSTEGLNGVFIEEYVEENTGKCFFELEKRGLFSYTNIDSRLNGWRFFSYMIGLGWK